MQDGTIRCSELLPSLCRHGKPFSLSLRHAEVHRNSERPSQVQLPFPPTSIPSLQYSSSLLGFSRTGLWTLCFLPFPTC